MPRSADLPADLPAANGTASGNTEPTVLGCVDAIDGDRLFGWAWMPDRAEHRVSLRILLDGKEAARLTADQSRADLLQHNIGDGSHAFEYRDPTGKPLLGRTLSVLPEGTTEGLPIIGQAASATNIVNLFERLIQLEKAIVKVAGSTRASTTPDGKLSDVTAELERLSRDIRAHDGALLRLDETGNRMLTDQDMTLLEARMRRSFFFYMAFTWVAVALGFAAGIGFAAASSGGWPAIFSRIAGWFAA
ncbi:hypothetical protein [Oceanibaculum pacificum]|nr:hypothetical protein [Oceanibaculum pacificum]